MDPNTVVLLPIKLEMELDIFRHALAAPIADRGTRLQWTQIAEKLKADYPNEKIPSVSNLLKHFMAQRGHYMSRSSPESKAILLHNCDENTIERKYKVIAEYLEGISKLKATESSAPAPAAAAPRVAAKEKETPATATEPAPAQAPAAAKEPSKKATKEKEKEKEKEKADATPVAEPAAEPPVPKTPTKQTKKATKTAAPTPAPAPAVEDSETTTTTTSTAAAAVPPETTDEQPPPPAKKGRKSTAASKAAASEQPSAADTPATPAKPRQTKKAQQAAAAAENTMSDAEPTVISSALAAAKSTQDPLEYVQINRIMETLRPAVNEFSNLDPAVAEAYRSIVRDNLEFTRTEYHNQQMMRALQLADNLGVLLARSQDSLADLVAHVTGAPARHAPSELSLVGDAPDTTTKPASKRKSTAAQTSTPKRTRS